MKSLEIFIRGIPKGQPRAKVARRGSFAHVYDPGTADEWKAIVRGEVATVWDRQPFVGPVSVSLTFFFPRPKSHFLTGKRAGWLRQNAPKYHTSRPDRDNCDKAVLDALTNLGLWKDDSQVCYGVIQKLYANGLPGMNLCVMELEDIND